MVFSAPRLVDGRSGMPTKQGSVEAARPHTFEAKHRILREYLRAWYPILLRAPFTNRLTVLDAFAGPGVYPDGNLGSPVLLLEELLARPDLIAIGKPVHFIFIENDREDFAILDGLLAERFSALPLHITIERKHGRCQDYAESILAQSGAFGRGRPIFANLDAEGLDVPFPLVRRIAANDASEVFVTMLTMRLMQFAKNPNQKADLQYGGPSWRGVLEMPSSEKVNYLVGAYRQTLRRAGFSGTLTFSMVEERGYTLHLHFATKGERGFERMKDAFWKVDPVQGVRYRDPKDPGQQTFQIQLEPDLSSLKERITEELLADGGWHTMEQVRKFVWPTLYKPVHATSAIQQLLAQGRIERRPRTGRLTTAVKLRLMPSLF
ncbi:MAG: three-Cys-motif partner protein TcmP [Actinomycetota bacterium]